MKNETLYNKTVDILVQAYFNDTLLHGDCCACAVGNLVAGNLGIKMIKHGKKDISWNNDRSPVWDQVFMTCSMQKSPEVHIDEYHGVAKKEIDSTGYTVHELARIEFAFETVSHKWYGYNSDEHMYDGLMAVVDCLDIIHENTDTIVTEKQKLRFDKKLQHS